MNCPNVGCGATIALGTAFCPRCGTPLGGGTGTRVTALVAEESGRRYAVLLPEVLIGRRDPATQPYPDIDLTPDDPERSVSRRHARLTRRAGHYVLTVDAGARTPGAINGAVLLKGAAVTVPNGARITLGTVRLRFEA